MDLEKKLEQIKPYQLNCNVFSVYDYPTAYSMQELLNKFFETINNCVDLCNNVLDLTKWLVSTGLEQEVAKKLQQWLEDGTLANLINKTLFKEINDKINKINFLFSDFEKRPGENNDFPRLERAINQLPINSTLLIEEGVYEFDNNIITINRKVNIKGQGIPGFNPDNDEMEGGTILKNLKIRPNTYGLNFENFGLYSKSIDNGFEGSTGYCENITIKNCIVRVKSHGYLFESYQGINKNIKIENCYSYNSTHGFVSKAFDVIFNNCKAFNHNGGYGFAVISDNIPGGANKGIANNNKIINCYSKNCTRGYSFYARDNHSTNNSNSIELKRLQVLNCISDSCEIPMLFGDIFTTDNITNVEISDSTVSNFTEYGTRNDKSILIGYSYGSIFNNPIVSQPIDYSSFARDIILIENTKKNSKVSKEINYLDVNTNFPKLKYNSPNMIYKTKNTVKTQIKGFLNSVDGFIITILIDDDNTIISSGNNIKMSKSIKGRGSYVILKYYNDFWNEIFSYSSNKANSQKNIVQDATPINLENGTIVDIVGSGSTSNTISVDGVANFISISIRSVGGVLTYGGFDSSKFLQNDIPTTIDRFGKVITANFTYIEELKKYSCSSFVINTI